MKVHKMKLVTKAFDNISSGVKKIEVRLNDEKRQQINVGDEIIFEEANNPDRFMKTKVVDLIHKSSFEELLNMYEDMSIFYDSEISRKELLDLYYTFYTKEDETKYGVLGIKIEVEKE